MDLEECVQVNEVVALLQHAGFIFYFFGFLYLVAMAGLSFLFCLPLADHRWNAHTALHPLSSSASSGELGFVQTLSEDPNSHVTR